MASSNHPDAGIPSLILTSRKWVLPNPCIYMDAGGDVFYMGVYVDDIILAGRTDDRIKEVIATLSRKFDIKDMGELHYFLGMIVMQDEKQRSVWVGQTTFTENLLKRFGMQDCKPVSTPVDIGSKLVIAADEDECTINSCISLQSEA